MSNPSTSDKTLSATAHLHFVIEVNEKQFGLLNILVRRFESARV